MKPETLIVVAACNHDFDANLETYQGGEVLRVDTSEGGYATGAYIRAWREHPDFDSYLFIQDSMRGIVDDVVAPFREKGADVVAWGFFPFPQYDNEGQRRWVEEQFPNPARPPFGIFGPIFFATNHAMRRAEPYFPEIPRTRIEFQGTERAWAITFLHAGFEVTAFDDWNPGKMSNGSYPVFQKTFALRP